METGRFSDLPTAIREELLASVAAGEEVTDLMEGIEDGIPRSVPPSPEREKSPEQQQRKRKFKISKEDLTAIVAQVVSQMNEKVGASGSRPQPVRAQPPSLFSGKRGSFLYFCNKLEAYAKLTNVPGDKWVALGEQHLEERPTKVWEAHKRKLEREQREEEVNWKTFKLFMSKRYDSTDTVAVARQKLDRVYQGNESVEKYIERFMSLLSDVEAEYEMCAQDQLHLFCKGLTAPLKLASTVNPATGKPFTDLEDLCSYVVKYEASLKTVNMGDAQGPARKKVALHHYTQLGAVVPQFQPPVDQVQSWFPVPLVGAVGGPAVGAPRKIDSRKFIPPDRQCYFCKQLGHESWQCPAKREYLAAKAKGAGHTPSHFQPGYFPAQPKGPPFAAPVQGGAPLSLPWEEKTGKGKGKKRGKKKGGSAKAG